jgi:hypothetical protein
MSRYINNFDHDNWVYRLSHNEISGENKASVTLFFDADNKHQGDRSLKCDYSFTGNSGGQPYEQIRLEKIWTHRFRTDLSFHPVSLSLWLSITMYSWLNFRPGTGAFDEYWTYLKDRGLLNDRRTSK